MLVTNDRFGSVRDVLLAMYLNFLSGSGALIYSLLWLVNFLYLRCA